MKCFDFRSSLKIRVAIGRLRSTVFTLFFLTISIAYLGISAPRAHAAEPIRIAVIAPTEQIDGKAIVQGAELAVRDINAAGGVHGRQLKLYKFEDHLSATSAVQAWKKAVQQDHVVAGVGIFASEVALGLEPWVGRLKVPFIDTGSASTKISQEVHEDYARLKYMFINNLNGVQLAKMTCQSVHDTLIKNSTPIER